MPCTPVNNGTINCPPCVAGVTGVTLIFTSSTGSNYKSMDFSGNATIDLSAPPTGPTAGMVIFQDRNTPSSVTANLGGGSGQLFTGALYFPSTSLDYGGNASTQSCGQFNPALGVDRFGHRHRLFACRQTGIDPALDEHLDDRPRRQSQIESGDDVPAQMVQSLHRAQRGQCRDHAICKCEAWPVPHHTERQFGAQIGVVRYEMRPRLGASKSVGAPL